MRVDTIGPIDAKIMLVGEAPGETEERTGKPFKGYAGRTLDSLLRAAGINRHECLITNVARERPPGNKISFFFEGRHDVKFPTPKPIMKDWVEELKADIKKYKPNIVVALGATANWALNGENAIADWRGYINESSLVPGQKVISCYHPQKINYEWKLHFSAIMDLRKALRNCDTPNLPVDNRRLIANPSKREFTEYLNFLIHDHKDPVVVDLETTSPGCHIEIIGFADSPSHAMGFRMLQNRKPRFTKEDELSLWQLIAQVFAKRPIVGHNLAFDSAVMFHHHGIYAKNQHFDTMLAVHCCWPEVPRSLGFLTSICLNVPMWKQTASEAPVLYNAADCGNTYGCFLFMQEELKKGNRKDTFDFEMSQLEPSQFLQLQGISLDKERQKQLAEEGEERLEELREELSELAGQHVIFHSSEGVGLNINSSQQLQKLLYIDRGLEVQYARRQSRFDARKKTVNEEALTKLIRKSDDPILHKVVEAKKLIKLRTFINVKPSPAGKVHTSYNITGATMQREKKGLVIDDEDSYRSFGRWSSSKSIILPYGSGNHQNIPYVARKMYVPPPGYEIIQADYVQAEAVVVAYEIRDIKLTKMFQKSFGLKPSERKAKGYDVHRITASSMFGVALEDVTPEQRQVGKTLRHAISYSAGPGVLMNKLNISMKEAKYLLQLYFQRTPQLTLWHRIIKQQLRDNGRVLVNLRGREHKFLDRWPKPGKDGTLFRSGISYKPQSTVGDLLNESLVDFYYNYGKSRSVALQLHDAIYAFSPLGEQNRLVTLAMLWECMKREVTSSYGDKYFIDVDFAAGPSWGETEELDIGTKDVEEMSLL